MKGLVFFLWIVLAWIVLVLTKVPGAAQMIRTGEADAATQEQQPAIELVTCRQKGKHRFTPYDHRTQPRERLFPKYTISGEELQKGKLSSKRQPCPGGEGIPIYTSEPLTKPAYHPGDKHHFWMVMVLLSNGGHINPITVIREQTPSRAVILYHPETGRYCIRGWEAGCLVETGEAERQESQSPGSP